MTPSSCSCTRKRFVGGLAAVAAALGMPRVARAAPTPYPMRELWLERLDSGAKVIAPFCKDGRTLYLPGYYSLCEMLRDAHVSWRRGAKYIDVRLIQALWEVQGYFWSAGVREPLVIHSGYRSPETNAATEGAARNSLHMWGMAADFHIPGVSIDDLWQVSAACPLSGGVGYYPEGWVHLDVGPKRYWAG
jgi:uncharacterized protein YcbK (DUF882 family)